MRSRSRGVRLASLRPSARTGEGGVHRPTEPHTVNDDGTNANHHGQHAYVVGGNDVLAIALAAIPIVALGFANGGFYAESWGWATLGLAGVIVVASVIVKRPLVGRRSLGLLTVLGALTCWIALSTLWSRSESLTVPEVQRVVLYVTAVAAAVLLVRISRWRSLVFGVMTGLGIVVIWGLISYLVERDRTPAVFEGFLLHAPMGYANAMAIAAVMTILVALGFTTDSSQFVLRFGCALLLVPLASALALTGSRAAWGALAVGLVVAIASSPRRWATVRFWAVLLAVPAASAVVFLRADLDDVSIIGTRADRLGNLMLGVLVALTVLSALPALLVAPRWGAERPGLVLSPRTLTLVVGGAVCVTIAVLALVKPDLGGDRPTYWRVALDAFTDHPIAGVGAGTYHQLWLENRPIASSVRDAHSIVIEGLAELGVVGVVLIILLLGAPLLWGRGVRDHALVPAVMAAFAGFVVHALVDWDWEVPAVTIAGLFLGTSLAFAADAEAGSLPMSRRIRLTVGVTGGALCVVAVASVIGASALDDAQRALAEGDAVSAERSARRAERWQVWAVEPLLTAGRAQLALSRNDAARESFTRAVERDPNDYRAWLGLAAVSEGDARTLAILRARMLNPRSVSAGGKVACRGRPACKRRSAPYRAG